MKKVLNVGGNSKAIPIPAYYDGWEHLLLDIDPKGGPDILCDARELDTLEPDMFDAVYCSHNLEHYYKHHVPSVLGGFLHVLKESGFADIRVPDIDAVIQHAAANNMDIEDVLYTSPAGDITVHDVLYGFGKEMERSGNDFFAHKTGFTAKSLQRALEAAGFTYMVLSRGNLEVRALAFLKRPDKSTRELLGLKEPAELTEKKEHAISISQESLRGDGLKLDGFFPGLKPAVEDTDSGVEQTDDLESLVRNTPGEDPQHVDMLMEAYRYHRQGKYREAETTYSKITGFKSLNYDWYFNHAGALRQLERFEDARQKYTLALDQRSNDPAALKGLAQVLEKLGENSAAIECRQQLALLKPSQAANWNRLGSLLWRQQQFREALDSFDRALAIKPDSTTFACNRSAVLHMLGRFGEALETLEQLVSRKPDDTQILCNKGAVLKDLGRIREALDCFDRALTLDPGMTVALLNRASSLEIIGEYAQASEIYRALLDEGADDELLRGNLARCLRFMCDWQDMGSLNSALVEGVASGAHCIDPHTFMSITDNVKLQLQCAKNRAAFTVMPREAPDFPRQPRADGKICVAYISADFREHPVSYLMSGVIEHHDRDRFHVIGVALRKPDNSETAKRITGAFDEFLVIDDKSDNEASQLLREKQISIAVDLMGFTRAARSQLMARRVAPLQINYLGFPGSMGADFMDYIIADHYLIPGQHAGAYSEAIAYMPDCFQANDRLRRPGAMELTRSRVGLPEKGFVFCSFNQNSKLGPELFKLWMELLDEVPNSVLWIYLITEESLANVRRAASGHGIDPQRIVAAGRADYPEHLRRLQLADLLLDTFPFNGGATASDALCAGLPLVTCSGEAFASRMAGSLLHAIEVPELIVDTLAGYKTLALDLARNPDRLRSIRARLEANREGSPIFDTALFTRGLESAYSAMWNRYLANLAPETIDVARTASESTP